MVLDGSKIGAQGGFQSLPPELSIQVILGCMPAVMDSKGRQHFLTLRTICSQWRSICFATPTLWSSLAIRIDEDHGADDNKAEELHDKVQGWFGRAGSNHLLELSIEEAFGLSRMGIKLFASMIHDYASRWRILNLNVTYATLTFLLRKPSKEDMTWASLQSLYIDLERHFF